jgi:hypothetical protein
VKGSLPVPTVEGPRMDVIIFEIFGQTCGNGWKMDGKWMEMGSKHVKLAVKLKMWCVCVGAAGKYTGTTRGILGIDTKVSWAVSRIFCSAIDNNQYNVLVLAELQFRHTYQFT